MKNLILFVVTSILGMLVIYWGYSIGDENPIQNSHFFASCIVWVLAMAALVLGIKPFSKTKK